MSSINRWNPVRDLINLREAMDQFVNEGLSRPRDYRSVWQLPVDAYATEDAIMLVADVPGLTPEALEVTFEKDTLTVRGEFKNRVEGKNYLLQERVSGHFERTLTINTPIDSAKIEATFANGVLTLKLPKAEAVKPKQIAIKQV
jgi:HSP20 family protein